MHADTNRAAVDPFQLAGEQREIREMASAFASDRPWPNAIRWDDERQMPVGPLREAAGLGMAGVSVRSEHGGAGLSRLDAALIFEALGRGCPAFAAYLAVHNMVAWMVDRFGTPEQRATWLPRLCSMDALGAYCLTEPDSGSDAAALNTRAVKRGDSYVINGVKQFISGAGEAGPCVAMSRTGGPGPRGVTALLVEQGTPGLAFGRREDKLGWRAQPTAAVLLEDVHVAVSNRLGDEGAGFAIAMAGLDGTRMNIAACSLGGAAIALERAIAYTADREAFGGALARLQSVQFQLADMATELEAARALLRRAASALEASDPAARRLCAMAKRFVTDAALAVADRAPQLHGGYALLSEYELEKLVRDLRVNQIVGGTGEIMQSLVARELVGETT